MVQDHGTWQPQHVQGFTVADPSFTLHRTRRPRPKLRQVVPVSIDDVNTIVRSRMPRAFHGLTGIVCSCKRHVPVASIACALLQSHVSKLRAVTHAQPAVRMPAKGVRVARSSRPPLSARLSQDQTLGVCARQTARWHEGARA